MLLSKSCGHLSDRSPLILQQPRTQLKHSLSFSYLGEYSNQHQTRLITLQPSPIRRFHTEPPPVKRVFEPLRFNRVSLVFCPPDQWHFESDEQIEKLICKLKMQDSGEVILTATLEYFQSLANDFTDNISHIDNNRESNIGSMLETYTDINKVPQHSPSRAEAKVTITKVPPEKYIISIDLPSAEIEKNEHLFNYSPEAEREAFYSSIRENLTNLFKNTCESELILGTDTKVYRRPKAGFFQRLVPLTSDTSIENFTYYFDYAHEFRWNPKKLDFKPLSDELSIAISRIAKSIKNGDSINVKINKLGCKSPISTFLVLCTNPIKLSQGTYWLFSTDNPIALRLSNLLENAIRPPLKPDPEIKEPEVEIAQPSETDSLTEVETVQPLDHESPSEVETVQPLDHESPSEVETVQPLDHESLTEVEPKPVPQVIMAPKPKKLTSHLIEPQKKQKVKLSSMTPHLFAIDNLQHLRKIIQEDSQTPILLLVDVRYFIPSRTKLTTEPNSSTSEKFTIVSKSTKSILKKFRRKGVLVYFYCLDNDSEQRVDWRNRAEVCGLKQGKHYDQVLPLNKVNKKLSFSDVNIHELQQKMVLLRHIYIVGNQQISRNTVENAIKSIEPEDEIQRKVFIASENSYFSEEVLPSNSWEKKLSSLKKDETRLKLKPTEEEQEADALHQLNEQFLMLEAQMKRKTRELSPFREKNKFLKGIIDDLPDVNFETRD